MSQEEEISFEQCLERLEAIVREIEGGNLTLDAAMARFTEGMELIKKCRALLSGAEQKLYLIMEDASNQPQLVLADFKKDSANGI